MLPQPIFTGQDGVRFIFWGFYKDALWGFAKDGFSAFWTFTEVLLLKVTTWLSIILRRGSWLLYFVRLFNCINDHLGARFAT